MSDNIKHTQVAALTQPAQVSAVESNTAYAELQARQINECYGDCPTNPATCPSPCNFVGRASHGQAPAGAADQDGEAFRTAAHLGLTLRFHGGCAQSSMPGTPSAYEVVAGSDRAVVMREAVQRAAAVIENGGESQRLDTPTAQAAPAAGAVAGPVVPVEVTDAIRAAGFTLVRGTDGYSLLKLGNVQAQSLQPRNMLIKRDEWDSLSTGAKELLNAAAAPTPAAQVEAWDREDIAEAAMLAEIPDSKLESLFLALPARSTQADSGVQEDAARWGAVAFDLRDRANRNEAPGNELYVIGLREAADEIDAARAQQKEGL